MNQIIDNAGEAFDIRDVVGSFAYEMELKLQENDHKGGWQNLTEEQAISRLNEEVQELQEVMFSEYFSKEAVASEAADVANFAMFIWDNFGRNK